MTWIKKTGKWMEPKRPAGPPAGVAAPDEEDTLLQLLPEDLKTKTSFNAWEVATTIGVSKRTVEGWIQSALLEVVRLPGGRVRIARRALVAFLKKYNSPS